MIKPISVILAATVMAAASAFAQDAGMNSATPAGSSNVTPSGSATGVNSPTGTTTGTGVGVANNPTPRIRTFTRQNSQMNTGAAGMGRGRR